MISTEVVTAGVPQGSIDVSNDLILFLYTTVLSNHTFMQSVMIKKKLKEYLSRVFTQWLIGFMRTMTLNTG